MSLLGSLLQDVNLSPPGSPSDTGSGANDFLTCNITRCGTVSGETDPGSMTTGYGITNSQSCGYFGCLSNADNAGGPQTGKIIGHSQKMGFVQYLQASYIPGHIPELVSDIVMAFMTLLGPGIVRIFGDNLITEVTASLIGGSMIHDVYNMMGDIRTGNWGAATSEVSDIGYSIFVAVTRQLTVTELMEVALVEGGLSVASGGVWDETSVSLFAVSLTATIGSFLDNAAQSYAQYGNS